MPSDIAAMRRARGGFLHRTTIDATVGLSVTRANPMHEYNRLRQLMLCFFGFYLAMSIAQLHARQIGVPVARNISAARIIASVEWHISEMGRLQQEQGPIFWPGD